MFNLLVSGNGERWATLPYTSPIDRFKEDSGVEAKATDLARPETLRRLEEIPTLLANGSSAKHSAPVLAMTRRSRLNCARVRCE